MTAAKFRSDLLEALREIGEQMAFTGDQFRSRAQTKAYEAILGAGDAVKSPQDLKGIAGVGETIISKAEQIYRGEVPDTLTQARNDPARVFTGIHGIGGKKAVELVKTHGITTVAELRERAGELLNDVQRMGLKQYDDFMKRIPRGEITKHEKKIGAAMKAKYPEVEWSIVGSQRRGAKTSGDIDVIVREPAGGAGNMLKEVVELLEQEGYIIDRLALGKKKFMGVARVGAKGVPRRLDVMVTPPEEYWFAILYFTGSAAFNVAMRGHALTLGMTLNEHGLARMEGGKKGAMVDVHPEREQDIFDQLGLEYVEPEKRVDVSSLRIKGGAAVATAAPAAPVVKKVRRRTQKKGVAAAAVAGGGAVLEDLFATYRADGPESLRAMSKDDVLAMLKEADFRYHNTGTPALTDAQQDLLVEYIEDTQPGAAELKEVGAELPEGEKKVKLPVYMPSLDKIKPARGDFGGWVSKQKKQGFVVSDKLDGISLLLVRKGGVTKMQTRGDGAEGRDVSHLVTKIRGVPADMPEGMVVRGEAVVPRREFVEGGWAEENPKMRNFVAGAIGAKTERTAKLAVIRFVAYELISPETVAERQWPMLEEAGFETAWHESQGDLTMDLMKTLIVSRRDGGPQDVDGVVMTANVLGKRGRANPEHSKAFKMIVDDQLAESRVLAVDWNISKDRFWKPTIRVEPVRIGNKLVASLTGKNAAFIVDMGIGVGARIVVEDSGDVIPNVNRVVEEAPAVIGKRGREEREAALLPQDVPWTWNATRKDIVAPADFERGDLRVREIVNFFKRVGVENVSEGILRRIQEAGVATTIPEVIALRKDKLLTMPRVGERMAAKIEGAIREGIEKADLATLIVASNQLGRGVGVRRLKAILEAEPTLFSDGGVGEDPTAAQARLMNVDGLGAKTAQQIVDNLPGLREFVRSVKPDLLRASAAPVVGAAGSGKSAGVLHGRVFVFTGFRDKDLAQKITAMGGEVGDGITRATTDVVVADESKMDTGKAGAAKARGIPILTRAGLGEMLEKL